MSPDYVASSITLGNFTVGRLYRARKSDMPDSSRRRFLPPTAIKSGLQVAHISDFFPPTPIISRSGDF